jgi:hypothetical protein
MELTIAVERELVDEVDLGDRKRALLEPIL